MERNTLKQFIAVAHTLNFTEASKTCMISRQGIRQNIHALEFELGCKLVQVEKNHVSLTPAGEALLISMAPVMELFDKQERDLLAFLHQTDEIVFGYPTTLYPFVLPTLLQSLQQIEASSSSWHITTKPFVPAALMEAFIAAEVDTALCMTMLPSGIPHAHISILREGYVGITMSAMHPLAQACKSADRPEDVFSPACLAAERLIGFDAPDITLVPLRDWMRDAGETLVVEPFESVVSVLYEVEHNQALFIDVYTDDAPGLGPEFYTVPLRRFPFHLCLIQQSAHAQSISQKIFRDQCLKYLTPML